MIWLTWRQFRAQAAVALGVLGATAVLLVVTGLDLRHIYDTSGVAMCRAHGDCGVLEPAFLSHDRVLRDLLGPALLAIPAILGIFWGAPLVAHELESGSYRLIWTQSVTRTRWLAMKVMLLGFASIAVSGLFSLMVTWWFSPIDKVVLNRFTPGVFDERGIVAVGYAALAFALGLAAGTLIRRTVPAMASALVAFIAARLAVTIWVRPHLASPVQTNMGLSSVPNLGFEQGSQGAEPFLAGNPTIPEAWVNSSQIVDKGGHLPSAQSLHSFLVRACPEIASSPKSGARPAPAAFQDCIAQLSTKFHLLVTYQPASRYWLFQVYELAIFLALALLVTGISFWWIRRDAPHRSEREARRTDKGRGNDEGDRLSRPALRSAQ